MTTSTPGEIREPARASAYSLSAQPANRRPQSDRLAWQSPGQRSVTTDAGWRNYHFVKLTTDEGIVGWSEFDEGFGSPRLGAVIERLA